VTMAKVAILFDAFPSYLSKCVATLADRENVQVLAYCRLEGPFPNVMEPLRRHPHIHLVEQSSSESVLEECKKFAPQLAVITMKRRGLFADAAAAWRKAGTIVIGACDHLWVGNWRNYANVIAARLGWFSQYEAVMVCGALGKMYAKKIGFPEQAIFDGLYTCDTEIFQPIGLRRHAEEAGDDWPRVFLFVGQYIRRKGFDILLKAYRSYRRKAANPWELWLVGSGDLAKEIGAEPGVSNLGEKSSAEVADIMRQSGCFVLPSRVDHWGVVTHEAASAGLPVLVSSMCGSSVELVQSGFNGYVFPVADETTLARALLLMDEGGAAREMGKNSLQISHRFSPELWAKRLLQDIPLFLRERPL
jgi:glycosyltransferase involved in cell wall biosynthesis